MAITGSAWVLGQDPGYPWGVYGADPWAWQHNNWWVFPYMFGDFSSVSVAPRPSGPPGNGTQAGQPCTLQSPSGVYQVDPSAVPSFQPPMADALSSAFRDLNSEGIVPMITSGFRTAADQLWLRKGGSGPNPAATVSWHQVGMAVDLNTQTRSFSAIRAAMVAQGLTWGGTFSRRDPVHFQLAPAGTTPGLTAITACGGD